MPLNTMKDLLIEQLNELHSGEQHSAEILPKLADAASNPKLAAALRSHAEDTQRHVSRLETVFEAIGVSPRPFARGESYGMKGLCRDCMNLAGMSGADSHVRDAALIAAAQHLEHDEIAGYGCARTWAQMLGHESASVLLQRSLDEERAADARLSRLAEALNRAALQPTSP